MTSEDLRSELEKEPFIPYFVGDQMHKIDLDRLLENEQFLPLRIHLKDGRNFDIPFPDAARTLSYGVLIFIGIKQGTRQAKGYDRFSFDQVDRVETIVKHGGRRKKAS